MCVKALPTPPVDLVADQQLDAQNMESIADDSIDMVVEKGAYARACMPSCVLCVRLWLMRHTHGSHVGLYGYPTRSIFSSPCPVCHERAVPGDKNIWSAVLCVL